MKIALANLAALDSLASDTHSDLLAIANILTVWDGFSALAGQARTKQVQDFCYQNFLSQGVLLSIQKNKAQFCSELYKLGLVSSSDPKVGNSGLLIIFLNFCLVRLRNVTRTADVRD